MSLFYLQFGGPMPGVPAQGMAMPGVPAAGGYPAQPYGAYQGTFPASPAQDPMWGYFTAIAGQVRAASYTVFFLSHYVVHVVNINLMSGW